MGKGGLDPAERRERAALQARAYGPDADGSLDPASAARLVELQSTARTAAPATAEPASTTPALTPRSGPGPGRGRGPGPGRSADSLRSRATHSSDAASNEGVGRGRRDSATTTRGRVSRIRNRPHTIAVAVVAVLGLVLGAAAAVRTVVANAPVPVTRLSAEPGAPGFLVGGSTFAPPRFPISEDMQWSAPLGTVLGWDVWVGRSRSNFACLAVVRSQTVHADCVTAGDFEASGVTIFLPPNDIGADLRPAELVGSAAVAYRWAPDRSVTVQVQR